MAGIDPRPQLVDSFVNGSRCVECKQTTAMPVPHCPVCRAEVIPARFGPQGRVWSSTVVRIEVPGRPAPRVLAYVDLDDGPRLLAHVAGAETALALGVVVSLTQPTAAGDPQVEVTS